ncbi:DUF397 domain-containing protein [Streptomyces sp. SHP 1-2]|uniref:DUF397 domain-containing protein n=1 Tax=Streptomyces sp. SHP 1-2 TaxID=2769489 RepID=UPI00223871C5|nr:DUF397 domain-containing protein [Streptomyces sp. SHP 1-2]MCW5252392.1 DUF397 domain-containing protein [Streptomyces sp. SHP 1-2]
MKIPQTAAEPLRWARSTYSSGEGGECVEIAPAPAAVHVRDSKTPAHGTLTVRPDTWTAFLGLARQG